ncbi:MAG: ribonuclease HII [Bacilli bacterium]|nr:ribonuclease HII [Bacilli bacterium]
MKDLYKYEKALLKKGITYIGGIDEAGRGPLVGPVVSACVVLPKKFNLPGLTDSKKLSAKKRDIFYDLIKEQALGIGIGIVNAKKIDEINIYEATKEAMIMALNNVKCPIEHVLIDAMKLDIKIPSTSIIKGDNKSISIAAASVIAKVTRDRIMLELDQQYPLYGFKNHKGYPTKKHLSAIKKYGIFNEYRLTYKPIKQYLVENQK